MAQIKIACWNIFFSHKLVSKRNGKWRIHPKERTRAGNVAAIIKDIRADVLGIVECMPLEKLEFFRDTFFPGQALKIEGDNNRLNIGLMYDPDRVEVAKLRIPKGSWKMRIGYNARLRTYTFSRVPLVVAIKDKQTGSEFVTAVVHPKSKKTYTDDPGEPVANRKKIVAQGLRVRKIMSDVAARQPSFKRFIVMGDANDGPGFDDDEAKIAVSGVEALIGSVLRPADIYYSFVDLSDGGIPTTPFEGAPQLDHILYSQDMLKRGGPAIRRATGRVRSDLVDFSAGSGKKRDSDHAPVEVSVRV